MTRDPSERPARGSARRRGREPFVGRACPACGSATVIAPCAACGAWFIVCGDCAAEGASFGRYVRADGRCPECAPWAIGDCGEAPEFRPARRRVRKGGEH